MTTAPAPSGQVDPAIAAIIASLANGSSQAASADDPPIYYGSAPKRGVQDPRTGSYSFVDDGGSITKPLSAYNQQFYSLDKTALTQFQQRAYQAGLYGNSTPRFGDYDDDTYKLWQDVGVRSARFLAAGQKFTPGDVLDMSLQSAPLAQQHARAYGTRTDVVNVQDAATVREAAHAAFKAVTGKGRAVSDAKVAKFVQEFAAAQVGAQRGVNQAQDRAEVASRAAQDTVDAGGSPAQGPISQEVDLTMPDLASRSAEYARNADPSGAGAHDIANKFAMFTKILGGMV